MASNGSSTIGEKSKFTWGALVLLVCLTVSVVAFAYTVQGNVNVHCGNADAHHTTRDLDSTYARQTEVQQGFGSLEKRLDRIEQKLDRLQ
jgi:TolA-binding protein